MAYSIPQSVKNILETLEAASFEAFLVGGCVRDMLLGRDVNDWDITTNARPEKIQELFPDSFYENDFGTVGVKVRNWMAPTPEGRGADTSDEVVGVVEVTPYRLETQYSDKRHPDTVSFTDTLEDDLARRDFTVNAMAMDARGDIRDPFDGSDDLKNKLIRAVGSPEERFNEDALRLIRAVRFAAQLGFGVEEKTKKALKKNAGGLKVISAERMRDELTKIIESHNAEQGIRDLHELGLLEYILPELEEGVDVEQNLHHIYTVFEHNVRSLGYAVKFGSGTVVRMATLLHDIGKPRTKVGTGENASFHAHEYVGTKMAREALQRLKYPKDFTQQVENLTRNHMFYYDVDEVTERSVRRLVKKVGPENMDALLEVRRAERKGSGVPKAEPYRLRHLRYMIEKVQKDPLTVGMLKVSGEDVMKELGIKPGPRVGLILNALLEDVLDDPERNTKKYLESRMKELDKLSDVELKKLAEAGREKLEEKKEEIDKDIKGKYYVK